MNEEIYKQNILDHYKHPHNKGVLADFDTQKEVVTRAAETTLRCI